MNEIKAEALRLARVAAKRDIRDQGLKLHDYSACDLRIAGERWLDCHPELFEQALITWLRVSQNSKHMHRNRTPESSKGSTVHKSSSKVEA
jgi:hypothetical protein